MEIFEEALNISRILSESNIRWTFAGGIAVGIHGYIRATEVIDIVIDKNDLRELDQKLEHAGFIINQEPIQFKDGFTAFRRMKIVGKDYMVLDILIPPDNWKSSSSATPVRTTAKQFAAPIPR